MPRDRRQARAPLAVATHAHARPAAGPPRLRLQSRRVHPQLNADLTISFQGERYQLPRKRPFRDWIGRSSLLSCRPTATSSSSSASTASSTRSRARVAGADAAGEFKAPEESTAQQTTQAPERRPPKSDARDRRKRARSLLMPRLRHRRRQTRRAHPRSCRSRRRDGRRAAGRARARRRAAVREPGALITFWEALERFIEEGTPHHLRRRQGVAESSSSAGRAEVTEDELRGEIAARTPQPQPTVIELQRRA